MIAKWLMKRVLMSVIILFIISIICFLLIEIAPGSSAAAFYGGNAQLLNANEKARISEALSLDQPLIQRYISWSGEVLSGNLGYSYQEGRPVTTILIERLPDTLILFSVTIAFIVIFSISLGLIAGIKEDSLWDRSLSTISIVTSSIPSFWLGILFIYIFAIVLGILPSGGSQEIGGDDSVVDKIRHLILPASVIILTHTFIYARFIQENVKAEMQSYYVLAAISNGVRGRAIYTGVLRNSIIPYLNYLGVTIPSFFSGSIIIETLFSWPGIGQLTIDAILVKDFPLLMGSTLTIGILVVVSMLVIDLIIFILDPRLRKGGL